MNNIVRTLISIFLVLHGAVHIWYVVLSQKLINFQSEMGWTGKSWVLSKIFQESTIQVISTALFSLSTLLFIYSGALFFLQKQTWEKIGLISATISTITIVTFWDGSSEMLVEKGLIGVLINLVMLFIILL